MADTGKALLASCPNCQHVWPAVYLPMELERAARVLQRAICPKCGHDKLLLANADETAVYEAAHG